MKAVICREYTTPEGLEVGELPAPPLTEDGVRIAVAASALNFPDVLMIEGKYQFKSPFPFSPGMECAGEVLEVGPKVSAVKPGDRVAAHPWVNCFAEQVVAPETVVYPLPAAMEAGTAAGFTLTHGTVYHALVDRGELRAGEVLLVLGAAGGVGLVAVELGKQLGATVIAAASSREKLAVAASRGADHGVDYARDSLRDQVKALTDGRGADVIFDAVGGDMTDAAMRCINWNGRLLIIGFAGGRIAQVPANLVLLKGCAVVGVAYHTFCNRETAKSRRNMATLLQWWSEGRLKPHVSMTFPLERAAEAMRAMSERRITGKAVIEVR